MNKSAGSGSRGKNAAVELSQLPLVRGNAHQQGNRLWHNICALHPVTACPVAHVLPNSIVKARSMEPIYTQMVSFKKKKKLSSVASLSLNKIPSLPLKNYQNSTVHFNLSICFWVPKNTCLSIFDSEQRQPQRQTWKRNTPFENKRMKCWNMLQFREKTTDQRR